MSDYSPSLDTDRLIKFIKDDVVTKMDNYEREIRMLKGKWRTVLDRVPYLVLK